jgi:hypothetical protein
MTKLICTQCKTAKNASQIKLIADEYDNNNETISQYSLICNTCIKDSKEAQAAIKFKLNQTA